MRHSKTIVSDILSDLRTMDEEIASTLLVGNQIELIHEAGSLYNRLRELITKEYFMDEEYEWICAVGNRWNVICKSYEAEVGASSGVDEGAANIKDLLDDLFGDMRHRDDDSESI